MGRKKKSASDYRNEIDNLKTEWGDEHQRIRANHRKYKSALKRKRHKNATFEDTALLGNQNMRIDYLSGQKLTNLQKGLKKLRQPKQAKQQMERQPPQEILGQEMTQQP